MVGRRRFQSNLNQMTQNLENREEIKPVGMNIIFQKSREKVSTWFKSPEDPTQILVVVDMLLVGYDAPIVQVLYLDKAMKEHTTAGHCQS